ncbi:hypothetical protein BCR33DRAFT_723903, partial [Rhizoclosmatium globosum]
MPPKKRQPLTRKPAASKTTRVTKKSYAEAARSARTYADAARTAALSTPPESPSTIKKKPGRKPKRRSSVDDDDDDDLFGKKKGSVKRGKPGPKPKKKVSFSHPVAETKAKEDAGSSGGLCVV